MNVSHEIELLVQEIHRLGSKSKDDVFVISLSQSTLVKLNSFEAYS